MATTGHDNPPNQNGVEIDVSISCDRWDGALPSADEVCRRAAVAALNHVAGDIERAEVSIVLGDDEFVRDLNRRYRNIDKPTNVLSFPGDAAQRGRPGPTLLGDVVIALETVEAEAVRENKNLSDHVSHLVVHGVLHLFEFDHQTTRDAEIMEGHEIRILSSLNIENPYAD